VTRDQAEEPDSELAVVTRALAETREILIFDGDQVLSAVAPYVYRADMTGKTASEQNGT
jgi:hypothetical protein